jgi:diguanylate cyclase (GGDEF)-like protein
MHKLLAYLKSNSQECKKFASEFASLNNKRIVLGSVVAVIVHIAHIIVFSLGQPGTTLEQEWHTYIVTTHMIMLAVMGVAGVIALLLRGRKKRGLPEFLLQYILVSLLLAEGVILTYFDQLVTPNITPYIIFCLVVGVAFLIRPRFSLLLYAASYAAFFFAVGLRPYMENVVLSNRTNGFAMASIGFAISFIMWKYNILSIRQRSHIQSQQKKLMDMANLDPLTGLYNRRKFDAIIKQEIAQSSLTGRESSLIMMDIDFFKEINDTHGHPAGDLILIQFSQLLKNNMRKNDSLCRLGGEEFIMLLPDTPEGEAAAAAEKIRRLIENQIFTTGDKPVHLTASFGIAQLDYNLDPRLISQYSKADHALYIAKQNGRNQVIAV